MTDIATAARQLLAARELGVPIDTLAGEATPQSVDDAYAIQDAQLAVLGPIGGWKVGARDASAEPSCAPLPASLILRSPQTFTPFRFPLHLIEAEIAFTVGRGLPPRGAPYNEDDVAGALASVHAAIEIVGSRYTDFRAQPPLVQLADLGNNGALVVADGRRTETRVDQRQMTVRVDVAESPALVVTGGNTAGDVFRLLAWLANHAAARCGGLKAGQVITTGSCIGAYDVPHQTRVRATFDGLAPVEVSV